MATPWFHSNGPLWIMAIVGGLIVMMLVAVVSPRLFAAEGPGWLVSVLAGVIVAVGVVAWAYAKRRSGESEDHPPQQ